MCIEIAIAKYTLIDLVLIKTAAVTVVLGVLVIGKKVKGVVVERVPLRPYILL